MDNSGGVKKRAGWIAGPVHWGVIATLILLLFTLALYAAGNMPERGFTDATQFWLLKIQWYLSLFLCLFSFCALALSLRLMIRRPRFRYALGMGLYLLTGVLGMALALLNSFVVAITGGNG
jgi:formate hydrogenlyase subunit 3/multisubunit Na+/H+ antiporter MnhD subunit